LNQPHTYRLIIDDVLNSVRQNFEDAGADRDTLQSLQDRWEKKVVASRVAQFDPQSPQRLPVYPPPPPPGVIKMEPVDYPPFYPPHNPMAPHGDLGYPSAFIGGPSLSPPSSSGGMHFGGPPPPPPPIPGPSNGFRPNGKPKAPSRENSTKDDKDDMDSEHSDSEDSNSPLHHPTPSKPVIKPAKPPKARPAPSNDEEIGSDLDDSDDDDVVDDPEGDDAGLDSVLCTWDKVQRVKNKWKCVLKDGIMHVNGKDYLFSKCTGEFEW